MTAPVVALAVESAALTKHILDQKGHHIRQFDGGFLAVTETGDSLSGGQRVAIGVFTVT